ncbi:hypothetical protein [Clostridium weizhouense]|uniref:Phage protein n=1 Tax=Clostridium weizhouense TaxID=2859781 RepID=A0ABS7ALD4_9CLOT|nr:hypothetical protein [Clostridium weizhouense]MBW6409475.1 hypothetical protein [Clostridium weizhouense]
MAEIKIDGEVYREMKIKNLIVDGKEQNGFVISADQLKGKNQIQVTIETEPNIETPEPIKENK